MVKEMKKLFICFVFVLLLSACVPTPADNPAEEKELTLSEQVKAEFLHCWNAYRENAWGYDEVMPISGEGRNWYQESLLITPVDSLDTLIIMGLDQEADEAREYIVENLSFDKDVQVKSFEIVIRLLGGLLSSYQLTDDVRLLELAEDLGKRILPTFDSPTGMPYMMVNLKTGETSGAVSNPAEIGTIQMELGLLSKLTGNSIYYDKAKKATVECFNRRSKLDLIGQRINVETGEWVVDTCHLGGEIDSYFEYLIKCWMLFEDQDFKDMFDVLFPALLKYLPQEVDGELWYGRVNMHTGEHVASIYGALESFFPGLLIIGGETEKAARLHNAWFAIWQKYDIEPESYDFVKKEILNPSYHLRPEIIESAWYLWQTTGEQKYKDMAQTFLTSLSYNCRTGFGYAELSDVVKKTRKDKMESFFLAETLKYLYLLSLDEKEHHLLKGSVFSTEAHPMFKTFDN